MRVNPIKTHVLAPHKENHGGGGKCEIKTELPNSDDYDFSPLFVSPERASALQNEYSSKLDAVCYDKEGKIKPALKKMLDESEFIFELEKNKPEKLTIKEALLKSIHKEKPVDMVLFHATDTKETANKIIKNGFDPKHISRTDLGPGFYFAFSEGSARNYGSAVVMAKCQGSCGRADDKYYEKIANNAVISRIKDFLGLKSFGYPTSMIEHEKAKHIANEYVRNLLVNEMNYDIVKGPNCTVVYNPDAISDIKAMY